MTYFKECSDLNEVKAEYKRLAKLFHPDISGYDTTAEMQKINSEYIFACANVLKNGKKQYTAEEVEAEILNAKDYAAAIAAIINLEGIEIELCGAWIWVSGNTYQHRKIFKEAKFYFASKKVMWYFRGPEYANQTTGKKAGKPIDEIRAKYGSQAILGNFHKRPTLSA